ncbi:MAG: enoyl-CoA hydratase-related protein [Streptosporangiaceae bacterium]
MAVTDSVRYNISGAVATITLNRPEARNALTTGAKQALAETLAGASADEAIRAVVLTGAGQAFCAGQDLREHAEQLRAGGSPLDTVRQHYNPIITTIMTMPKPVLAALPGVAAGAGASIAFACDFRIAARRASLLLAFARVGLSADSGASWTLQRLVGPARAAELLMLAEPISAEQALALGLLTEVVADEDLDGAVAALAGRLASGPTAAFAGIKQSLLRAAGADLASALETEAEIQVQLGGSRDHRAATEAFLNKQQPHFEGR